MKRKLLQALTLSVLLGLVCGCAGQPSDSKGAGSVVSDGAEVSAIEKSAEEADAGKDAESNKAEKTSEESKETGKEVSLKEKFEAFLNNEEKAGLERVRGENYKAGNSVYLSQFTEDEVSFDELVEKMVFLYSDPYEEYTLGEVSYTYLDCGADGISELAVRIDLSGSYDESMIVTVIKEFDGKLQIVYQGIGSDRSSLDIVNSYGKIAEASFFGYDIYNNSIGYLNADGEYELACSDTVYYNAQAVLDKRFDKAIEQCADNLEERYLRVLRFKEGDSSQEEYFYCAEKEEDEPSNGIDFEENVKVLQGLFEEAGVKLYSLQEIYDLRVAREKELGLTEQKVEAGTVHWNQLSVKDRWRNSQAQAAGSGGEVTEGGPGDRITLPYREEKPYDENDYPSLVQEGSWTEGEVEQLEEGIADMMSSLLTEKNPDCQYGDGSTQTYLAVEGERTQVVEADVYNGAPEMDQLMKQFGYSDYYVTYYYPFDVWANDSGEMSLPVVAELTLGDNEYRYLFGGNELACRYQNGVITLQPKANDFIQGIYKLGCFYGNVMDGEKGRYNLTLMSHEQVEKDEGAYYISAQISGVSDRFVLIVDEATEFSAECYRESFEGYAEGDSPIEWMDKAKALSEGEDASMALVGVFDVKLTGNHVDYFCGCYWWD